MEESAIFSESQLKEKNKTSIKKPKLVKESVNKGILLKKFKPINFITGIQNHFEEGKKVSFFIQNNKKSISKMNIAAFNKKSKEYQEIICNSKSPSKNITKSFGIKNKSGRVSISRQEGNNSPNQYGSNYSKSSWNKHRKKKKSKNKVKEQKSKQKKTSKKKSEIIQIRPK